ncbi:zinc finger BED domain-containing protein 1-like [Chelonus insularis]|uniref:zinc finger BED domain-containing protein 1-like n=1 Tax=Chelonus insularis TaxID=460826 RepID=UPI00158C20F7|nr:zinc finger BED domain-containing protein 1-like [Chelonus insularis]
MFSTDEDDRGLETLYEEDPRRFKVWFRINKQDSFFVNGFTIQEYLDFKHKDEKVLEYIMKRFAEGSLPRSDEHVKALWMSIDGVEFSKAKSGKWNYFIEQDSKTAKCTFCSKIFQTCGNATNLKHHLLSKHKLFLSSSELQKFSKSTKRASNDRACDQTQTKKCKTTFTQIPQIFEHITSFTDGGKKFDRTTDSILFMLATDTMPLTTVDKRGFKQLIKILAPLYPIPSRKTFTSLADAKYKSLQAVLITELAAVRSYCSTCDIWTDVSNQSYLGVTIHYVPEKKITLSSRFLSLYSLNDHHTSQYITDSLLSVVDTFNLLNEKIVAVISDNATNIKKAVTDGYGIKRKSPCFAHILSHLVPSVIKVIPGLDKIISKVKDIVVRTKRSVTAPDTLRNLQIRDGKTEGTALKFIQDVETRWNSTLYMLERFLISEEYVYPVILKFPNPPRMIDPEEIQVLKDLIVLMKPVESVINKLSGDSYPTCSVLIPILHCMKMAIQSTKPETKEGKKFQQKLMSEILLKFENFESNTLLAISSILDPRFKQIHFESAIAAATAINYINDLMKSNYKSTCTEKQPVKNCNPGDLWTFHDKIATKKSGTVYMNDGMCLEFKQYLKQPVVNRFQNPIEYWKVPQDTYLVLSEIAVKYLCIVGTSVPSERLFS